MGATHRTRPWRPQRSPESGYAYLLALFMVLAMIVASQVAMQNLATQGRRQREAETIWRGNQYVRAIRLYYHKTGHYPQTADDLDKGMPELHFLRAAAYKDPMNTGDGSWRFIYVNAAGQIIGSTRYATLQQMAILDMNNGQLPATLPGVLPGLPGMSGPPVSTPPGASNPSAPGAQPGQNSTSTTGGTSGPQNPATDQSGQASQPSDQNPANAQQPGQPGAPVQPGATSQPSPAGQPANPLAQLQPTGPVDGPVLGGFLAGVGSKVDRPSIRVYHGGKKYLDWEFIWNPIEDQARAVQQGFNPGQQPGQIGQPIGPGGIGTGPGNGPGNPPVR